MGINENYLNIIRILGCLYIGYLGLVFSKKSFKPLILKQFKPFLLKMAVLKRLLVGISNPKDIIFFSAFFPQFVSISPHLDLSLTILTLTWIVLDFLTLSLVYIFFRRLSNSHLYPKILGLCGLLLLVIAVYGLYQTFI